MMATLGLEPFASRLASDLPIGVRQRLSLLCAVLHGPPIVFLDEPTSGVDPQARRVFWDLIYSLSREAGVTVLVSTHYMDEAAHCDRLGLMDQGRLIAVGSPAELKRDVGTTFGTSARRSEADDIRSAYRVVLRDRPDVGPVRQQHPCAKPQSGGRRIALTESARTGRRRARPRSNRSRCRWTKRSSTSSRRAEIAHA